MLRKEFFYSAAFVSALFPHALSAANPYQAEVGAEYTDVSSNDFFGDGRSLELYGTYYLNPVEAGEYPLSEAAFVSRASGISALLNEQQVDAPSNFLSGDADAQGLALSGWYVHPESGWLIFGSISREESDYQTEEIEADAYSLSVGKYLWDTTTLVVGYAHKDEDIDIDFRSFHCAGFGCADIVDPPNRETDRASVAFRHLGQYSDYHYAVDVGYARETEEQYHWEQDNDQYSFMFSAYPNRNTRIVLGFEKVNFRDRALADDTDTYRIGVEYFVTPAFAVFVSYEELKVDTDQMIPVFEPVTALSEDPFFGFFPDEPFVGILPPYRLEPVSLDTESLTVGARVRF
ncbi:putative porin [Pseudomaricurvus alkylphenolicus]|uniref:putative porin n=1 Tax=Pseudomaricurvus alkylphenolicus TaxID=1306991 RepID=UPI0014212DDE|nr:putative porin [Pseudomaricurvus alkylphenolicus]NIB41767.1 putative porin [Pseudomaricurvus alkylphenolicus]